MIEEPANPRPLRQPLPNAPVDRPVFEAHMPALAADEPPLVHLSGAPRLSVIVIVYRMRRQAMNTLRSLASCYQIGVNDSDYEVIVVENASSELLDPAEVAAIGPQFRYVLRHEREQTPVHAINYGASIARAAMIAVMIDGARMLTPGVLSFTLAAQRLSANAVVSVPGYHLGERLQQEAMLSGYDETVEQQLLAGIAWPEDGYRLFEIGCLSGTSIGGYFKPIGESNFVAVSRDVWARLGGFDPRFDESGGGQVNLDFYRRAVELPQSVLILLPGEGSFHQFHGGITTGQAGEVRRQAMIAHFAQYTTLRGAPYCPPAKRPIYLGAYPDNNMTVMERSARMRRLGRNDLGQPDE
jgi:hypothetical protein